MARWISPDRPTDFPARLTLWLGAGALIPALGPAIALCCAAVGIAGCVLCARYPERYTGKTKIYAGFALSFAALLLFFGESVLFFQWKLSQEYEQRVSVSSLRLSEISQALEKFREENGAYPDALGILAVKGTLEPKYSDDVPLLDGFGQAISAMSHSDGFSLRCFPPPFRGETLPRPSLAVQSTFKPAPQPVLPPAGEGSAAEGQAGPPAAGLSGASAQDTAAEAIEAPRAGP
jgi:hypothetical protein